MCDKCQEPTFHRVLIGGPIDRRSPSERLVDELTDKILEAFAWVWAARITINDGRSPSPRVEIELKHDYPKGVQITHAVRRWVYHELNSNMLPPTVGPVPVRVTTKRYPAGVLS